MNKKGTNNLNDKLQREFTFLNVFLTLKIAADLHELDLLSEFIHPRICSAINLTKER